ncbi:MAG: hypothetical protein H6669_06870 [Ardenticatenaceae bacterium]|nr:hypothetical protein [Ardenticatenaceae bacterium]
MRLCWPCRFPRRHDRPILVIRADGEDRFCGCCRTFALFVLDEPVNDPLVLMACVGLRADRIRG